MGCCGSGCRSHLPSMPTSCQPEVPLLPSGALADRLTLGTRSRALISEAPLRVAPSRRTRPAFLPPGEAEEQRVLCTAAIRVPHQSHSLATRSAVEAEKADVAALPLKAVAGAVGVAARWAPAAEAAVVVCHSEFGAPLRVAGTTSGAAAVPGRENEMALTIRGTISFGKAGKMRWGPLYGTSSHFARPGK